MNRFYTSIMIQNIYSYNSRMKTNSKNYPNLDIRCSIALSMPLYDSKPLSPPKSDSPTLFRFNFMLRNPPLHSPHELLLFTLSFYSLGQLPKPLMMGYGSKTKLAFKLVLIGFQGSLRSVFTTHLGCLLGFPRPLHILAKNNV